MIVRHMHIGVLVTLVVAGLLASCDQQTAKAPANAADATDKINQAMLAQLPFDDKRDFEDAKRGFIATIADMNITNAKGGVVWTLKGYDFLKADKAPPSVNPSLFRQAQLNLNNGLFKVVDRVYQVRGFDISNMTIIEGDSGLIVIDPLTAEETARAAINLYFQNRPKKPIVAVIYSHSHVDHFGGVKGVVDEADVAAGKTKVYAPRGFMEYAVAENVIAGTAMTRRAAFQFGPLLPRGERAQVDAGLGKTVATGNITLIPPTDVIDKDQDTRTIDGVEIMFQNAPHSEAPAEMHMFFPSLKVLNMAENVTHNLHNFLPLRGAAVRDSLAWSKYISQSIENFGPNAEVIIAQHHWPVWGNDRVLTLMRNHRDLYKFVHDQSVRLMNAGYTPGEIAEKIKLPSTLARDFSVRPYYGSLKHNAKAVYQKYLGWYDANPANLDPLPPADNAKKIVAYMGGSEAVIKKAREDYQKGEFRWVASVMKEVVFADPNNKEARELGADALEQLGFQSENATWRNAYLEGAMELRGAAPKPPDTSTASADLVRALTLEDFFDVLGIRVNADKADGKHIVINWRFTDTNQTYAMTLENATLTYVGNKQAKDADATVTLSRATLNAVVLKETSFPKAALLGDVKVDGSALKLAELFTTLDDQNSEFEVLTPIRKGS